MKRILTISILAATFLFTLPFTTGSASSSTNAAYGMDQDFAPGSIVQFDHFSSEDGLSQNAGLAFFKTAVVTCGSAHRMGLTVTMVTHSRFSNTTPMIPIP